MDIPVPAEVKLIVISILIFCSIMVSKTSYKFGIPTLLAVLAVGMLFGSDGLGIQFNNMIEAQTIGTIALCIILFTGGMDTRISEIRPVLKPGLVLSTAGVLLTTLFTGFFIFMISGWQRTEIGFTLLSSMLLAATMSSTDSASVFNILRSQKMNLKNNLRPMLELESGSNDPMAYLLTVLLIQCVQTGSISGWEIAVSFLLQFAVGIAGGYFLGKATVWIINHSHLNNAEFYPIMTLCFIFITFCSVYFLKGNGYLAVYIAGIIIGNSTICKKKEITTFLDGITWLFQIIMFLVLGLLVNPHEMLGVTVTAVLVGFFISFVARPLSVWLCLLPFGKQINGKSKGFISWVGLKGAAPIIFATYPVVENVPGANQIFNIVFFITIISLIVQGTTIPLAARKLKLDETATESGNNFGIELTEDIKASLQEKVCTSQMLRSGNRIREMEFDGSELVILVKRNGEYIVPKGDTEIIEGDILLMLEKKS